MIGKVGQNYGTKGKIIEKKKGGVATIDFFDIHQVTI